MASPSSIHRPSLLASAVSAMLMPMAQAADVGATATYSLDGAAATLLSDPVSGTSTGSVDVVQFTSSATSDIGLHTYGSATGNFGSRSSGNGWYDATGHFSIADTITNTAAAAQHAMFTFFVSPGVLSNTIRSNLVGSDFVSAGLAFNIKVNGSALWSSQASLLTNASGTTFNMSGVNLYTPAVAAPGTVSTTYTIAGKLYSIDLGVLNAGQSLSLQYDMSSYAKGNAQANGTTYSQPLQTVVVPDQSVFVPETTYQQWVPDASYGGNYGGWYGYGGGHYVTVVVAAHTNFQAGYTTTVGGYSFTNQSSGSHASSGDPFSIDFAGVPQTLGTAAAQPAALFFPASVPEPQSYALLLAALGVIVSLGRRKAR